MSATPDLSGAEWIKSTYSNGGGGECIEWSPKTALASGTVPIRDSKDPHGPALRFSPDAWASFISAVNAGEFPG
ncbi:DUF397 domain-containing protein [Streptantibioticus ferralitis]|uniref:DUF397 domain-containing protein n=1 Tax=Streptantibioticus ferralitis TaxID=236510 RepID=A0ABT5Z265_9ACTN|nr:DUF397 domain-containing protein [Streptantibioticus ferralitis]MDF2257784.1 DUF397 domain-containing protein [Streptantibioticus ferralitis]